MLEEVFDNYDRYICKILKTRFFKHKDVLGFLDSLGKYNISINNEGHSVEGRSINLLTFGNGGQKIFLWSQMHGDEPTATMALADLLTFFFADDEFNSFRKELLDSITFYIMPMVNPDGAEYFTRRNVQQIDINRDFNAQQSPEGKILRTTFDNIKPDFCFNLHDMGIEWSAGHTGNPATVALLAPAYNADLSINVARENAMKVIAGINKTLQKHILDYVGRWDDEFEPRAFGDNFQKNGASTILVETGGYKDDWEKQYVRKLAFLTILSGLVQISSQSYIKNDLKDYFAIPDNKKHHFSMIIRNCKLIYGETKYLIDIGLIINQKLNSDGKSVTPVYTIEEIGDMAEKFAYEEIDAQSLELIFIKPLFIETQADFILMNGTNRILSFENGHLSR